MVEKQITSAVITGPTGAIGVALCAELISHNVEVYAVCRPGTARVKNLPPKTKVVYCDLSDLSKLPQKVKRADAFFHLGWTNTIGDGRNDMKAQIANIAYTMDAVKAAKALNCSIFVGAGSQAEYGRSDKRLKSSTPCFPENGYGMAKLCAGEMSRVECKRLGIRHVWARILSVYGPYDSPATLVSSAINKMLNGEPLNCTNGEQIWDYLYSADAAKALFLLAQGGKDGEIYPIGSGKARPLKEYIKDISRVCNKSAVVNFGTIPYSATQIMYLCADIKALTQDTGFEPTVGFRRGIRETAKAMARANCLNDKKSTKR